MKKTLVDVRSLARSYSASAVNVLKSIMQQPEAPPAARVSAAQALLDRGWGKPEQASTVTIKRLNANQVADDELAHIATGGSEGVADAESDPPVTH